MRDVTTNSAGLFLRSLARAAERPEWEFEYRGECRDGLFEIEVLPVPAEPAKRRVTLIRDGEKRYDDLIPVTQLVIHADTLLNEMLASPKIGAETGEPTQPTGLLTLF